VTLAELKRLKDGIEDDEIDRVKAGLKSSLIMQEESTGARAGAIATDWYYPQPRTLVRRDPGHHRRSDTRVRTWLPLTATPVRNVTLVTLGPAPLTLPS